MDVGDVLRDRAHEPGGLERMVAISIGVHVALAAVAVLAPGRWWLHEMEAPRPVMTITLGGGDTGVGSGGLTSIGGRAVQTEAPPDAARRREPVLPPAARTPEMTLPLPKARPTKAPARTVTQAPDDARGRRPSAGAEVTAGTAAAETGVRGQGFGLSSGGSTGSGSYLDVGDFCCPDYLLTMVERIRANWSPRAEVGGDTVVKFTIQRDGTIADVALEKSSGYTALDLTAQRALYMTRQLPALPTPFPNPTLTVHLNFHYQR